jgi:16S rRNA (cytosine967-C5)-methyltransferase
MRSHAHINTAVNIIASYDGSLPLGAWLKQYFREQKKFGSTDRRQISHLCYCYYRLGNAFNQLDTEEKILTGIFLCSTLSNKALEELRPEWNEAVTRTPEEKLSLINAAAEAQHIFPFTTELSPEIDATDFQRSFLMQPDLFLRLRPGKKEQVLNKLRAAGTSFEEISADCLALPNGSKTDDIIILDEEAVVQDLNSQKVVQPVIERIASDTPINIWDCCAASGGKSILFHDHFPNARLTVSDIRETILINLRKRFLRAGIKSYAQFIVDLAAGKSIRGNFDLVVCDAPCSGSGTWGRTPEQLQFFKEEGIERYARLQKKIAVQAARNVKNKGYFLYITCSVFRKENEDVAAFIEQQASLKLQFMNYFKGYNSRSDTLFVALFINL